jgi:hypothetical protein
MRLREVLDKGLPRTQWTVHHSLAPGAVMYSARIGEDMLHVEFWATQITSWAEYVDMLFGIDRQQITDFVKGEFGLVESDDVVHVGFGINMSQETVGTNDSRTALRVLATVKDMCLDFHKPGNRYLIGSKDHNKLDVLARIYKKNGASIKTAEYQGIKFCLAES